MNVEQIDIELAAIEDIAHGEVATKINESIPRIGFKIFYKNTRK